MEARILIVDDDSNILEMAACFFSCQGLEVHCAAGGEEALRALRERTFLLMLTDFDMPGMNGLELAEKTREMAPGMPVVMGTGNYSPEILRLAAEAGIVRVFAKPFDLKEILAMIKRTIASN